MSEKDLLEKYIEPKKQKKAFKQLNKGIPVQYIIGEVDFFYCNIKVKKGVLIPRFETEELVDRLVKLINEKFGNKSIKIADLGTGSGAIAIALKKHVPSATVIGYDTSLKALKLARENAKYNNVDVTFKYKNIKTKINDKFDVVVSNPPYVSKEEIISDVVKNEPRKAIFAKDDGLEYYKKILKYAHESTKEKYIIAFEVGYKQGDLIKQEALKCFEEKQVEILPDLSGKDRFVFIISQNSNE